MGRIKPAALLLQSKRKKGTAKISGTAIAACNIVVIMCLVSIAFTRHKYRGEQGTSKVSDNVSDEELFIEPVQGDGSSQYAVLNTTEGLITLQLFAKMAPKIVQDFVSRSESGFYNGGVFHRAIKGFMIQGGAVEANGTQVQSVWEGDSDENLKSGAKLEPFTLTVENVGPDDKHGSQFFITTVGSSYLSTRHSVFGSVVGGQRVVQKIENLPTDSSDRPLTNVLIHNVNIKSSL